MLVTVKKAAEMLHVSCSTIRRLFSEEALDGGTPPGGGPLLITTASMATYILDHMDIYSDDLLAMTAKYRENSSESGRKAANTN